MRDPTNVFSELNPKWLDDVEGVGYDTDFWTIINFYLLHSLCSEQSWKGHSLQTPYKWRPDPWKQDSYLKDKIINAIWSNKTKELYMSENRRSFESKIAGKNLDEDFYTDVNQQRAGYVKVSNGKGNANEIMSLLYHIRDALAHGRYGFAKLSENDYMIFMEDGKKVGEQFEVTARIALKKSSLLKVREIIIRGPDKEPDYTANILCYIKTGKSSKKEIMGNLGITEKELNKYFGKMQSDNIIQYDRKARIWKLV